MASIINDANGLRRIQFVAPCGARKAIRLGKIERKSAEAIGRHVEALLAAKLCGETIPRTTAVWLTQCGDTLKAKLAAVGLTDACAKIPTLQEFLTEYLTYREAELKASTMMVLHQAARWLVRALGADVRLNTITPADADRARAFLLNGRAKATANKWTRYAKEFFNAAVRRKVVSANPFEHITGLAVVGNAARRVFVTDADIRKVLETIPCSQFRLIVALARYGGLRIPSEGLALTWADVNWEHSRLVVRASKTAHHADGGVRVVPIFAELRPFLEAVWDEAKEGEVRIFSRYTDVRMNLRTQFNRWILQAGLEPWMKPFQNMRATRATELADAFPSHTCAKWLGHTERIADEFYRSVTDEHYARATGVPLGGAKSGARVTQKEAQHVTAESRTEQKHSTENLASEGFLRDSATHCDILTNIKVGDTGFEPVTSSV